MTPTNYRRLPIFGGCHLYVLKPGDEVWAYNLIESRWFARQVLRHLFAIMKGPPC